MGTVYKLDLHATVLGQTSDNVFFYYSQSPVEYESLARGFASDVLPSILGICSDSTVWESIRVTNPREEVSTEYTLGLIDFEGIRVGNPSASFGAWGYLMQRGNGPMRSGGKRFGGIIEEDTNGNEPQGFFLNNLQNLESTLGIVFDFNGNEVFPMLWRPPDTTEDGIERLTQVRFGKFARLTTQKSRQKGHGSDGDTVASFSAVLDIVDAILPPNSNTKRYADWINDGGAPFAVEVVNGVDVITTFN